MFRMPGFPDYALLDSGHGEKLERFGPFVLRRPDPQALWRPHRAQAEWDAADLAFERDPESGGRRGTWRARRATTGGRAARARSTGSTGNTGSEVPTSWRIAWRSTSIVVEPTPFKHVGLFPEQAANWDLIERAGALLAGPAPSSAKPRLLNLFGYTGTASVVAARAGFAVTHVDASKTSLRGLEANLEHSALADAPVRIVLDDALAFARREVRRQARYHVILLDPPHHGRGPKGETWQFEEHLAPLIEACRELLDERGLVVLSTYAIGFSPLAFQNLLAEFEGGRVFADELAIPEERESGPPRFLPAGFCARFVRALELDVET